ncbi:hypothetical protein [Sphingomonas crocodyli]|uniref:hypothetical protein n=1 Tax=Sphingomonas crocodyli TaxID=1979270 RepID=UPI0013E37A39|nr:hypothetical protein [Sphingomonas crocodyli]
MDSEEAKLVAKLSAKGKSAYYSDRHNEEVATGKTGQVNGYPNTWGKLKRGGYNSL